MLGFTYYTPTKVEFGKGAVEKVGALMKQFGGTRVLIHYGGQSAVRSGVLDRVKKSLDEAGIFHVELGGVVPNPHLAKVREGIELSKANGVDFLLAVGGGSVIDSCKAIAYGLAEPEHDVWELYAGQRKAKACFPVASVLTIAAAGSEMSNSCVITNTDTDEKRAYDDDLARPRFAIMDPELTMTLPDYQTEAGCADIMMHTMERYFIPESQCEMTDEIAEGLLRTVIKNGPKVLENPSDYNAMAEIMWCGSLSHNGLTECGRGKDFSVHKFGHALSAKYDVAHGASLAAVWGAWAKYQYDEETVLWRFARFAEKVWGITEGSDHKRATEGIERTVAFFHSLGMPTSLHELDIPNPSDEDLRALSMDATQQDTVKLSRIRQLGAQEVYEIYQMAR